MSHMKFPDALDPYCYGVRVQRVIDGDSIKLHVNQGFGTWRLGTIFPGAEKEARYPQGVYRLAGIDTPEKHGATKAAGLESTARVNELLALGRDGDSILVKMNKNKLHGKYRYMVDLFVPIEPRPLPFDADLESEVWLEDDELEILVEQTKDATTSVIRAMATELLARRQPERSVIHVNKKLVEEGLAKPYFGGKKS